MAALEEVGFNFTYDYGSDFANQRQQSQAPGFLLEALGVDFFHDVAIAEQRESSVEIPLEDRHLEFLISLPRLVSLAFQTNLSSQRIVRLAECKYLDNIRFNGNFIHDAGIVELRDIRSDLLLTARSIELGARLLPDRLKNTPSWDGLAVAPPISPRRAIELAQRAAEAYAERQVNWNAVFERSVHQVSLLNYGFGENADKWYWEVTFEWHPVKRTFCWPPNWKFVVLMDETVLEPARRASFVSWYSHPPPWITPKIVGVAFGKEFMLYVPESRVAQTPEWNSESEYPPVWPRHAILLANQACDELQAVNPWDLMSKRVYSSGNLIRQGNHWYWSVTYGWHRPDAITSGPPRSLTFLVLMDGSVVSPVLVKNSS